MSVAVNTAGTGNFEFEALQAAENYRRALVREFAPHLGNRVIEVGAGIGQMTELFARAPGVATALAVEPDAKYALQFRQRLPHLPLFEGTAAQLTGEKSATSIVCINVLEHILEDEQELKTYARLLQPQSGKLCLFVPARPEIYAPLDGDFGHHRRYTKPELKRKLLAAGFEIDRLCYFNFIGYFAWWFSFCALKQRSFKVSSVRFFDRAIFPVGHALESKILRPPFGQSLLAVARIKS